MKQLVVLVIVLTCASAPHQMRKKRKSRTKKPLKKCADAMR